MDFRILLKLKLPLGAPWCTQYGFVLCGVAKRILDLSKLEESLLVPFFSVPASCCRRPEHQQARPPGAWRGCTEEGAALWRSTEEHCGALWDKATYARERELPLHECSIAPATVDPARLSIHFLFINNDLKVTEWQKISDFLSFLDDGIGFGNNQCYNTVFK